MTHTLKSLFSRIVILPFFAMTPAFIPNLTAQNGSDEVFLFFSDVIHAAERQTGLAFANQSGTIAQLTLYFVDDEGRLAQGAGISNQVPIEVGPGKQIARVLPEIFGSGIVGLPGFVIAEPDNIAVVGFFLTFDPNGIDVIDGADAIGAPLVKDGNFFSFLGGLSGALIFQEVLAGPGNTNKIVVLGLTGPSPGNGTLELVRNGQVVETQPIDFPAADFLFSRFTGRLEEIFETPLQNTDYVRASSFLGIAGYQSVGRSQSLTGRNAVPEPLLSNSRDNSSYGAQLALTPAINTFLKAVNPTFQPMDLKLEAFLTGAGAATESSPAGEAAAIRHVTLPARTAIREDLSEFLGLSDFVGWLRISSNRTGLISNASFGDREDNFFSSVQLQASPQRELVNSHVANGRGFGTGITFLNPFPDDVEVQVEFFNTEGARTGGGDVSLQGFEHRPLLLTDIDSNLASQIGGFIQITATQGIFSFELFFFVPPGTGSVASLSAVPPQRGNGFLEGVITPVQAGLLSILPASGTPLSSDYPASASRGVKLDPTWDFRPGEIIVKMKSSIAPATQADFFKSTQLRVHRQAPERVLLLRSADIETPAPVKMAELISTPKMALLKQGTLDLIERLNGHPDVEYAEPNYLVQPLGSVIPNDPFYPRQWHYPFINLPQAWELTTGDPNLVAAVIDTGAKFGHPDLAGRLTGGQFDFIDDPQIAGDGDGIDASAEDPGDDPLNPTFHGTHVAGTIVHCPESSRC